MKTIGKNIKVEDTIEIKDKDIDNIIKFIEEENNSNKKNTKDKLKYNTILKERSKLISLTKEYKNTIILFKSNDFYHAYNNDAFILHCYTGYKLIKKDTIKQIGFPYSSLNSIIYILDNYNINFVIILDNNKCINKTYNDNKYTKVLKELNDNYYINKEKKLLLDHIENLITDNNYKRIKEYIDEFK